MIARGELLTMEMFVDMREAEFSELRTALWLRALPTDRFQKNHLKGVLYCMGIACTEEELAGEH